MRKIGWEVENIGMGKSLKMVGIGTHRKIRPKMVPEEKK